MIGGDRPLHAIAIRVARDASIPVWVLEEGYIRPDFVTCELNGVNANSPLKKLAHIPDKLSEPPAQPVRLGNGFPSMAAYATAYQFGLALGKLFFPYYRHYRNRGLASEFFFWTRGAMRKALRWHANAKQIIDLVEHHSKKYFVVALQVSDDLQVTFHGDGWTAERLITSTIKSFSQFSDSSDLLVFKGHPLDRGRFNYGDLIREIAQIAGCEGRVSFIDDGSIGAMLRYAKGAIMINSTSGLSALHHGTPLLALGDALYKRPELTHGDGTAKEMDSFWTEPKQPDPEFARSLLADIRRDALINGSFYIRHGFQMTFANLLAKVCSAEWQTNVRPLPSATDVQNSDAQPFSETRRSAG